MKKNITLFVSLIFFPLLAQALCWTDESGRTVCESMMQRQVITTVNVCSFLLVFGTLIEIIFLVFVMLKKMSKWWLGIPLAVILGAVSFKGIISFVTRTTDLSVYIGIFYSVLFLGSIFLFCFCCCKLGNERKKRMPKGDKK